MVATRYDYDSILDRLKRRVLSKLNGKNLLLFSTNSAILESVAEELSDFAMYDEYLTRENIWETARGHSSIIKQVSKYGYNPHRKIGATGYITLSSSKDFAKGHSRAIPILKWTKVSGGGLNFVITSENGIILQNTPFCKFPIVQGDITEFSQVINPTHFPTGTDYIQLTIEDSAIDNSIYEVRVNGVLWKEISSLRLTVQYDDPGKIEVYVVKTLPDFSGVTLFFGNNSFGKSLNYGDIVSFTYLKTIGESGNVLSSGIINSVDSTMFDDLGNKVEMYCRNDDILMGGKDYESLADIKTFAPLAFQTTDRAITIQDYINLILLTKELDVVYVWGEKEVNEEKGNTPGTFLESYENLIYITGYSVDKSSGLGVSITETNKENIRTFLNSRKGVTDILQFVDTELFYITFKSVIRIQDFSYTIPQVTKDVHDSLANAFSISKSTYGKNLFFSEYISTIQKVPGVKYCSCSFMISRFILFDHGYEFNFDINLLNIKRGSVEVKVKYELDDDWVLVGKDIPTTKNSGNIVGASRSYTIANTTITYQTGKIGNVNIQGLTKDPTKYQVRVDFQLDDIEEGNLKLLTKRQIYGWYNSLVDAEFIS